MVEATQLSNYVFSVATQADSSEDEGDESLLVLGVVSMVNHGAQDAVNTELRAVSDRLTELRARRPIAEGEELLVSYGAAEWFTDRGLQLQGSAAVAEQARAPAAGEASRLCLSDVALDPIQGTVVAQRPLATGERLVSPAFVLPRASVPEGEAAGCSFGHPASDALLLPLAFPGRLQDGGEQASVRYSLRGPPSPALDRGARELCDSPVLRVDIELTVARPVKRGEAITVQYGGGGSPSSAAQSPIPALEDVFPRSWGESIDKARREAAEGGDVGAMYQLAQALRLGSLGAARPPDQQAAMPWYRRAAEGGHAAAQLRMGVTYHDGLGVEADPAEAVDWYRRAAAQGSASAQFVLGLAYSNGDGVPRNASEATQWFLKAAAQGSSNFRKAAKAMYNLGVAYREGIGVERDLSLAMDWFTKAADRGSAKAQYNLGVAYSRGDAVAADAAVAAHWYEAAASQGHMMAQYNLAVAYSSGAGVLQDDRLAVGWFERSAEQGSGNGQFMMGLCLSLGRGMPADPVAAVAWYRKAADQGHAQAMHNLAALLEMGAQGLAPDPAEAKLWFGRAAERGVERRQPPGGGEEAPSPFRLLLSSLLGRLLALFGVAGSGGNGDEL